MNTSNSILNAVIEGTGDVVYVRDLEGRFILINTAGAQLLGHTPDEIRAKNPTDLVTLETAQQLMALDQGVIASGQKQTTDERIRSAAGVRIFETVRAPYRDDDNRIIGVVGISRDVTAQRRQAELNRFRAEASSMLASTIDYETRLANVANLAVSEIADWCVVHMVADNGAIEQLALAHIDPSKVVWARELQQRYPPRYDSPGGLAEVLRSGKPQLVPEITEEMLAQSGVDAEQLALIRQAGLKSYMVVPLIARGRTLGAITFVSTDRGHIFDANDLTVAENLASRAAIYIDNARLYRGMQQLNESLEQRVAERTADLAAANLMLRSSYKQVRALAAKLQSVREEERTHIARELHDGLGQALTALKFDLAWLVGRLAKMDGALRDKAQAITAQIDETIKTVRRLSSELRPAMLDDFGLAASIESHAQEFQERTGILCDLSDVDPEPALTRTQSTALFRIFQETMTNVARHAQATRIDIRLSAADGVLCLQVQDNGRGLLPGVLTGTHSLGVLGMRERAELMDGTLTISGGPGSGTTVTVSIPLHPAGSGTP